MKYIFLLAIFFANSAFSSSLTMICTGNVLVSDREGGWNKMPFEKSSLIIDISKKSITLGNSLSYPLGFISSSAYATAEEMDVNKHKDFARIDRITGKLKAWNGIGSSGENTSSSILELDCKPSGPMI